ncbi:unnamed protein product [Phytomonas sp. Hart1]|nr:unnamed protein product [Phytomonas sp. Hart1]|eukprot:CCW71613.1 unnamed protein product [Phytomonas sp. isolate Hart1]
MSIGVHSSHSVFGRNYIPDGVSRPLSILTRQRGQTIQRIDSLRASLSSIVSSRMHQLDSQSSKCASKVFEGFDNTAEALTGNEGSLSGLNDNDLSRKPPEDCGGMEPMTLATAMPCPIASSETLSLFPLSLKTSDTDHRGSHLLLGAHRQIEALIREKHNLERTCLNYENHINELKQRCIGYSKGLATTPLGAQLVEKSVSMHSQGPPSSSQLALKVQDNDAHCSVLLDSRETSQGVQLKSVPFSAIEPLLRLFHQLSTGYPELLLGMDSPLDVEGSPSLPPEDWPNQEWGIGKDGVNDSSPNHLAILDFKEEEVFRILKHLENILPCLMSSSRTMGFLTSAGASLLDWVKALEDKAVENRAKVLEIAEKLQMANEALNTQLVEKEANLKASEKREESLKEVIELINAEFVKQQSCCDIQNEHIQNLSYELRHLAESKTLEAKELMASRQQAIQEMEALTEQVEQLKRVSEADEVAHASQIERLQCKLEETQSFLTSAESECLSLVKELEALRQEQLIAKTPNQPHDFLEECLGQEEMKAVASEDFSTDHPTIVELQRLMDISALVSAEHEERQLIELCGQINLNGFYCVLFSDFHKDLQVARQVALDVGSRVAALTTELRELKGAELVGREAKRSDGPPPGSSSEPTTLTLMLDLSPLQSQVNSLEDKATSLEALLDTIEGISVETQDRSDESALLDECAPTADGEEDNDGSRFSILPKELHKTQQCLASLTKQMDLLYCRIKHSRVLPNAQDRLPCGECIVGGMASDPPDRPPPTEGERVGSPSRLPPISVRWLAFDSTGPDDGEAGMAVPPTPRRYWDLDEVVAALTQRAGPAHEAPRGWGLGGGFLWRGPPPGPGHGPIAARHPVFRPLGLFSLAIAGRLPGPETG